MSERAPTVSDPVVDVLVADGRVPSARLAEVLERQVVSGGAIETAALEMGLLDEDAALDVLGRAYGGSTADRGLLERIPADAIAVLPRRIAERHRLCPVSLAGRMLIVAARPPENETAFATLLDELGFALSLHIDALITTEPRLSWALHRAYQLPVPPRHEALLALWGDDGSDDDAPLARVLDALDPLDDTSGARAALEPSGWRAPPPSTEATSAPVFEGLGDDDTSGWSVPAPGAALPVVDDAPVAVATALAVVPEGAVDDEAAARVAEHLARLDVVADAALARRRERVLWTVDDALAELALAETRDELLEVTLRFAWRRLHTALLFVRQGAELVLWDVLDETLVMSDVERASPGGFRVDVDADADHAIAHAVRLRSPSLGPVAKSDPLVRLLGRAPRAFLIVPVLLGDRVIGAVVADNADKAIPPAALAELHMVVPRLGRALGNLVLRRKKLAQSPAARAPTTSTSTSTSTTTSTTAQLPPEQEQEQEQPVAVPMAPALEHPAPAIVLEEGEEDIVLDDAAFAALSDAPAAPRSSTLLTLPSLTPSTMPSSTTLTLTAPRDRDSDVPATPSRATSGPASSEASAPPSFAGDIVLAESPGRNARESLLLATWRSWISAPDSRSAEDATVDELVGALDGSGDAQKAALARLVGLGARGAAALARAFPGVLARHPFEGGPTTSLSTPPTPFFAALVRLGPDAVAPIVVAELDHADRLHRWGAIVACGLLDVPAALPRLAQRAFDAEPLLATLAVQVLFTKERTPAKEAVLARLRDLARRGDDFERLRAVRALAALRDGDASAVLIDLLSTRPKEIAEAARAALVELSCQDFGTAERRWQAWFADHGHEPRRQWLVEGLAHKDLAIRRAAADELRDDGVALFDYRPDAPTREREAALAAVKAQL